ncbi:MAG TPA: thiamine pyrophosphate-dependent enzyme, partial [Ktedonobacteraceae bacterium]
FICEQDSAQPLTDTSSSASYIRGLTLPAGLTHQYIDGSDVITVYAAMCSAMQRARQGQGPTLIEMHVTRSLPNLDMHTVQEESNTNGTRECDDPLVHSQHYLQAQGAWDEEWAKLLCTRLSSEVESALQDAIRDTHQTIEASGLLR